MMPNDPWNLCFAILSTMEDCQEITKHLLLLYDLLIHLFLVNCLSTVRFFLHERRDKFGSSSFGDWHSWIHLSVQKHMHVHHFELWICDASACREQVTCYKELSNCITWAPGPHPWCLLGSENSNHYHLSCKALLKNFGLAMSRSPRSFGQQTMF